MDSGNDGVDWFRSNRHFVAESAGVHRQAGVSAGVQDRPLPVRRPWSPHAHPAAECPLAPTAASVPVHQRGGGIRSLRVAHHARYAHRPHSDSNRVTHRSALDQLRNIPPLHSDHRADRQSGWLHPRHNQDLLLANPGVDESHPDDSVHESTTDWICRSGIPKRVHPHISDAPTEAASRFELKSIRYSADPGNTNSPTHLTLPMP